MEMFCLRTGRWNPFIQNVSLRIEHFNVHEFHLKKRTKINNSNNNRVGCGVSRGIDEKRMTEC